MNKLRRILVVLTLLHLPGLTGIAQDLATEERTDPAKDTAYVDSSEATGSSVAVVPSDVPLAHTAQILPLSLNGSEHAPGDVQEQARRVLQLLAFVLKEAETGWERAVKLNVYLAEPRYRLQVERVIADFFTTPAKPAVTWVAGRLPHPNVLVAMDAIAISPKYSGKRVIRLSSPAVYQTEGTSHVAILPPGSRVFVSGQAVRKDSLKASATATMESLEKSLRYLNLGWENVVQVKCFLKPASEAREIAYGMNRFFPGQEVPPLSFVQWDNTNPIEIELVVAAGLPEPGLPAIEYFTPPGMTKSPTFSRIVKVNHGRLIYFSGLNGGYQLNAAAQVDEIYRDLEYLLRRQGSDLRHLAKATYYVEDPASQDALRDLRKQFYDPERPPASSLAKVESVAKDGHTVTVDMIGVTSR